MDPRRGVLAIVVFFAGIVLVWFLLAEGLVSLDTFRVSSLDTPPVVEKGQRSFVLTHSREANMHSYSGTLELPTPCHTLSSSVQVGGGSARTASISLITEAPAEGTVCAQVTDAQEFSVSFTSEETPSVILLLNGTSTPVSLVEKN